MKKKKILIFFVILALVTTTISGVIVFNFLEFKLKEDGVFETRSIPNHDNILRTPTPTITITPSATSTPTPTPNIFQGLPINKFYITYYGYPDNDPAGRIIAYPKSRYKNSLHQEAGGTGTYGNPITFAAAKDSIPIGTLYYVPYIRKYIILEDICASCTGDGTHIDIWLESNENFEEEVLSCQRKWTRQRIEVITRPTPNLPVSTMPLFNKTSGECINY